MISTTHKHNAIAAMLLGLALSAHGFTTPLQASRRSTIQRLNLVPEQGSQLVAAFHASTAAKEDEEEEDQEDSTKPRNADLGSSSDDETHRKLVSHAATTEDKINITVGEVGFDDKQAGGFPVTTAAKAVISRIFSIPGAIMGRHPAAAPATILDDAIVGARGSGSDENGDDVVYYPIVGFQFVRIQDDDDTDKDNDTLNVRVLPTISNPSCRITNASDQDLYGWFCTACQLESFDSEHYCDGWKAQEERRLMEEEEEEVETVSEASSS